MGEMDEQDWDVVAGVVDEMRDQRTYSDVVLPFTARSDGFVLQGTKFSIGGFELLMRATDANTGDQITLDHRAFAKADQPFHLRILLSGFVLELSIRAGFVGIEGEGEDERLLFAITEMSPREEQALRRVIRAYLSGQIANADDVVRALDAPTGSLKGKPAPVVEVKPSRLKTRLIAGVSSVVCAGALTLSVISLYDKYMITESRFAAITAPKVDILSPGHGKLDLLAPAAGGQISRDDPLFIIEDKALEADVILSRTRIDYLQDARDRTNEILNPRDLSALDPAQVEAVTAVVSGAEPEKTVFDELSLEMGHLKSLKLRQAGLRDFSPCDCVVMWAEEDGAWLNEGEPLITLAKRRPADMRVEALVKLKHAQDMVPGQTAFVRLSGQEDLIDARIETVLLDGMKQPRVGFPKWLRQDQSLGAVTLTLDAALSPDAIGVPAEVYITEQLPLMERLKHAWNTWW